MIFWLEQHKKELILPASTTRNLLLDPKTRSFRVRKPLKKNKLRLSNA